MKKLIFALSLLFLAACDGDYQTELYAETLEYIPTVCVKNAGVKKVYASHWTSRPPEGNRIHHWKMRIFCNDGAMFDKRFQVKQEHSIQ
jgi:hypothetical protein